MATLHRVVSHEESSEKFIKEKGKHQRLFEAPEATFMFASSKGPTGVNT